MNSAYMNFAETDFVSKRFISGQQPVQHYLKDFFRNGAIIIDIRPNDAYHQEHIKGTTNIPLEKLKLAIPALKQINRVYILVCETGASSSIAVNMLRNEGIEAYNGGCWKQISEIVLN